MRKLFVYLGFVAALACGCVLAAWLSRAFHPPDNRVAMTPGGQNRVPPGPGGPPSKLSILYPLDGAVFPPEIAPPTFRWEDPRSDVGRWRIIIDFQDRSPPASFLSTAKQWTPSDEEWKRIKQRSCERRSRVTIEGCRDEPSLERGDSSPLSVSPHHAAPEKAAVNRRTPKCAAPRILSTGSVSISTSRDPVGAPLFFREVNLPFLTAVKDPAAYIRWRFGEVSSKQPPPIVLEKLPVCGNCHSFSADGSTLAMEVDSGNNKRSYAIAPIAKEIVLDPSKIISWSDYRREDHEKTFGLLCQVSPDGRYVVGTVKDRALAVYRPELAFSQLFFLVKGILAIYDRRTRTIHALPGADDRRRVQTNGTWSPDGKWIVFARSRSPAYDPPSLRRHATVLVPRREADAFLKGGRTFLYDLYRIPFNEGKGGKAEPLRGASDNGMSNYFAKYSPDGKWIVFCKAKSFMLLQPDSELYIVPAQGGEARRLRCNTRRMNSWHSWSPNGKWLVFSSKAYSPYTQLFLTHIDQQGESTPPVVLEHFTEKNRAANIPEFVNVKAGAIQKIREAFLDDTNCVRAGDAFRNQGEYQSAIAWYRRAAGMNPKNTDAQVNWGTSLLSLGKAEEAKAHFVRAIEIDPGVAEAHCGLGMTLRQEHKWSEAVDAFREALRRKPDFALAHLHLGSLLLDLGRFGEAERQLSEAVRLAPNDPYAHYNLGLAYAALGRYPEAAAAAETALQTAMARQNTGLAETIRKLLDFCRQRTTKR